MLHLTDNNPSLRRAYEQRVREVEHSSFTPLVMSLSEGCGNAASTCFKRLVFMLMLKWDQPCIQQNSSLDEMQAFIHPLEICNPVYTRGPFVQQPCTQIVHSLY